MNMTDYRMKEVVVKQKQEGSSNGVVAENEKCKLQYLRGTIKFFKKCGRSAQLLILENDGWSRLNKWTEFVISCKDGLLMKEILNVLLTMPTSCSQLLENRHGLPITLQKLLKRLALKSNEFGEDSESIKMLCCDVFVKWLLVKKRKTEEVDTERISILDGRTGLPTGAVLVPIKHVSEVEYGYFAENGVIRVVQINKAFYPPLPPPPPLPPLVIPPSPPNYCSSNSSFASVSPPQPSPGSDVSSDNNENTTLSLEVAGSGRQEENRVTEKRGDNSKKRSSGISHGGKPQNDNNKRRKQAPRVFVTSKSRSESLLAEMMLDHSVEKSSPSKPPLSSDSPCEKQKLDDKCEPPINEKKLVASKNEPSSCEEVPVPVVNKPINMLEKCAALSLDEIEKSDLLLKSIGEDLGKPKKLVHWWGLDGVRNVHHYDSFEVYERAGFAKEKKPSFTLRESDDEVDGSSSGLDRMVIDEEQDCVVGKEVPVDSNKKKRKSPKSELDDKKDANSTLWKPPQKIYFTKLKDIPFEVETTETAVQKLRESMVLQLDLGPGSSSPDCPVESDVDDEEQVDENDDESTIRFATPIISTEDVLDHRIKPRDRTEVYDYSQEKWPEPKGSLDPRTIRRH